MCRWLKQAMAANQPIEHVIVVVLTLCFRWLLKFFFRGVKTRFFRANPFARPDNFALLAFHPTCCMLHAAVSASVSASASPCLVLCSLLFPPIFLI